MFRISLVRIFLQKYHHQASDGVGVYFRVCECTEGRVHEGRGNAKLQKRKWGMVLLHLISGKPWSKKCVVFFFWNLVSLSYAQRNKFYKIKLYKSKIMWIRELKQFCADSLDHPNQHADPWEEQGRGTVRCGCYGNHVLIGIRLRNRDSSLAPHFPFLFLTGP